VIRSEATMMREFSFATDTATMCIFDVECLKHHLLTMQTGGACQKTNSSQNVCAADSS